ncbi:flagellar basal body rod protein FlgC [Phorcysia thermohydrogeniphila]|uniref:Flagellar basal-body rod protein FlgC n=1 Tax=Phorcysia thermohydrogeniphila TaxID=936138 RepID=A0A4R1G7X7_9BACT|nr:flagellar basal body rod protein FlgC [Phorcysia thermohydrogeniphila]TCK03884.1 flagellar basal-body rod protein FlgC [Phorcysia thermohydrogeniphila]
MLFKGLEISLTGMLAQRVRMDIHASNLANANSLDENGNPYRRKIPVFEAVLEDVGKTKAYRVRVKKIVEDPSPFKLKYDPSNPLADEKGYVKLPNVDPLREMVDMISAMRTYEANLTAFNTHKGMILSSLSLLKA